MCSLTTARPSPCFAPSAGGRSRRSRAASSCHRSTRRCSRRRSGAAGGGARLAGLLPLDRAADRVDLLPRRTRPAEERVERGRELAPLHARRVLPVVVYAAVVSE